MTVETATRELVRMPFGTDPEVIGEVLQRDGGMVLTGALTAEEVAAANAEIEPLLGNFKIGSFAADVNGVTQREETDETLEVYPGMRTRHMQHVVLRSKTIRERFIARKELGEYVAKLTPATPGTHTLFASTVIEIHPGEIAQTLHRDGGEMFRDAGMENANTPAYLTNTLLALSKSTDEMGATRILLGSHLWEDFNDWGSPEDAIPVELEPGDVFIYSAKVIHGGGANVTKDKVRRLVANAFSYPWMIGEEAWPFVADLEEVKTYPVEIQNMLKFRSISYMGEEPGFMWRKDQRPLQEFLNL
jgi:ectoine hydroxylase-related dioxygenase (phytanoyl-CoA dioxygenase family)